MSGINSHNYKSIKPITMKAIIQVVFLSIFLFFLFSTEIGFKSFKLTFNKPLLGIGVVLLVLAIVFISLHSHNVGYSKGFTDSVDEIERINELLRRNSHE